MTPNGVRRQEECRGGRGREQAAGWPSPAAAGTPGSGVENRYGREAPGLQHWQRLPCRGRCDSCCFWVAGSSSLQSPLAGLEGARGRGGLELELCTLHLVLATSSLEGFISTCLCLRGFLEAKRSISAVVTPPWAWNIQRRGAHYHSP